MGSSTIFLRQWRPNPHPRSRLQKQQPGFLVTTSYVIAASSRISIATNFDSQDIKKLCSVASIEKSKTTPYHPLSNGTAERLTKRCSICWVLSITRNWPENRMCLFGPYIQLDPTRPEGFGYLPCFVMFGRHPRLAVNASNRKIASQGQNTYAAIL